MRWVTLVLFLQLFFQGWGGLSAQAFVPFTIPFFADPPSLPNNITCLDNHHQSLGFMNSQVLQWKANTQNQYTNRAMVQGPIVKLLPDHTGHTHFGITLGQNQGGDLEVIYNDEFGELPPLSVGTPVIACGDYITVGRGAHLPSPFGAIIHWVHFNPGTRDGGAHPGGFLVINGKPYGFTNPPLN